MNGELLSVLELMEREKGIDRKVLLEAIESSLLSAARKSVEMHNDVSVKIDPETGKMQAYAGFTVVKKVTSPEVEISLKDALKSNPDAKVGDVVSGEIMPEDFGRIAAQTAKQIIIQKIREAEKDVIYNEYKEKVTQIVTGMVRRIERGSVIVDFGKTEAVLPSREQVPTEEYTLGMRIRVYVLEVRNVSRGPEIIVSRTHPGLVRRLFELEVPEIYDNVVEIRGIARDPGYRTKLAVFSKDEKVDCVGACVGMKGSRVKNVVRELNGEKIDIVRWSDDTKTFLTNSLSPAELKQITMDPDQQKMTVLVEEDQLSLAIGKRGQNARLSSKLLGWKIDIQKASSVLQGIEEAKKLLSLQLDISQDKAQKLIEAGFNTVEGIREADIEDIVAIEVFSKEDAEVLVQKAKDSGQSKERDEKDELEKKAAEMLKKLKKKT